MLKNLGLKKNETGVLVTEISPGSSGSKALKEMDVILSINNTNIDDNGLYNSGEYGSLNFYGIIYLNHFIDDEINMQIIRKKKEKEYKIQTKTFC